MNEVLRVDLGYLSREASSPTGRAGLVNGTYSALAQLAIQPTSDLQLGLTYIRHYSADGDLAHRTGSSFANLPFGENVPLVSNSYGVEAFWRMTPQLAISGWFGYTDARRVDGSNGQADIINYAVNLAFPDLFAEGAVGGLGFGMPPRVTRSAIATRADPGTGLHVEAFYEYPLTDNIKLIPGVIYLTNPEHNAANDDVVIGIIRSVFTF
ncbi:iron uptake porin [Oculatella sp. LEGE 06141]|uniref:iron uptake porin n=1 Tax=Oculatella sp. LEGE 06141 TaxID=1828648 RepID=UPI00187DE8F3|nr:iron uptake porin [Oculatella sp. LEGE 06141]MBE9177317.1 iron uptake porin [Oculatella sp. LEGE 06141]